jgi:hypothetical protein
MGANMLRNSMQWASSMLATALGLAVGENAETMLPTYVTVSPGAYDFPAEVGFQFDYNKNGEQGVRAWANLFGVNVEQEDAITGVILRAIFTVNDVRFNCYTVNYNLTTSSTSDSYEPPF